MGSESDGALWSRSEASDVSLTAAMRAVDAADAHYQRALLLTCVKKWRASYRKRRTQWKQQLLATHHAHYARLWTAFNVWRQRTIEARKRKQQIEAACTVGAGFFQRLFFQRWRAYVAQQKLQRRRRQALLVQAEKAKRRVARACFTKWRTFEQEEMKPPDRCMNQNRMKRVSEWQLNSRRHLRVQGSAIRSVRQHQVLSTSKISSEASATALAAAASLKSNALRRLVESRVKRRHFKTWTVIVSGMRRELEQNATVAMQVVHFQVRQAVTRWKKHLSAARERALLKKRAFFFLYFCLTKKSLMQLKKHAELKKKARLVAEMANNRLKRQVMRDMVAFSSQRRCIRRVFVAWQAHTTSQHKRIENPATQSVKLLVYNKYRSRLLQEAFRSWRQQFVQKQVYASVIRVVERYRVRAIRLAWTRWRQLLAQLSRIQQMEDNRRARNLNQVWVAWRLRTQRATTKELNRRLAVRFTYQRLLRRGFNSFLVALQQTQDIAGQAEVMRNERIRNMLVNCFAGWSTFVTRSRMRTRRQSEATCFHQAKLLRRVLRLGWTQFVLSKTARRTKLETAQEHYNERLRHKVFQRWKESWMEQRQRQELLNLKAANFVEHTNRQRKAQVLQQWLEYLRKRQTSRLISAYARGQWQLKLLHKSFAGWTSHIAELRWQQIQNQRARQQYEAKLKQKSFQVWTRKLAALKHHRDTNRQALVHWKLTVERKAFVGLKAYAARKKRERARMHNALEFRHRLIVNDGVHHWMTAALHLQAQRENHASQSQAQHAVRICRLVARIARHWRAWAVNRRVSAVRSPSVKSYGYAVEAPEFWLIREGQRRVGQHRAPPISVIIKENREPVGSKLRNNATKSGATTTTGPRHALSEFVTLPKNRPQPRRPIDLLLANAAIEDERRPDPATADDASTTVYNVDAGDLHAKYGFEFPAQPFQPLDVNHQYYQQQHPAPVVHEAKAPLRMQTADTPREVEFPRPSSISQKAAPHESTLSQLDALEAQLQVWKTRKQELRMLQDKIETYRQHIQDPSSRQRYNVSLISSPLLCTAGHVYCNLTDLPSNRLDTMCTTHSSPFTIRQMQMELSTMEKQYDACSSKWLVSKERIRAISQEILRLYAALQVTQ